jgi:hypothetical protein
MNATAWATTASNTLGADPGITVNDGNGTDLAVIDDDPGEGEHGDLDTASADFILECHGWVRLGEWTRSGGQWAAEVDHA